jgi:nitroimidazol reductase NimA-like FMN-containing flavoprotein (pyridoxamine 5'-phosphate oxidase superfamily)
MADAHDSAGPGPKASRPYMGGYDVPEASRGMVPWEWARERLGRSHNYWLATARRDGAPHAMPVWGVWVGGAWYCSTGAGTRKARNLAENPRCVVCNEDAAEAVILEGVARRLPDAGVPRQVRADYQAKYGWDLTGPVFEVRPRVVFAMPEQDFPAGVTRWDFA